MEIIPAIDILGGRCVRLYQGDYTQETVFDEDPVAVAVRWAQEGARRIHVVDLDGAREGRPVNIDLVRAIVRTVDCSVQMGGGVRDLTTLGMLLDAGLDRVVLGTAAVRDTTLLREAVAMARDRLIVSVDARDGLVRVAGWTEGSALQAVALIEQVAALGVRRVVYTDITRDGTHQGPNIAMYRRLTGATSLKVIAAGGVASIEDLHGLAACGVEAAIVGRALYTGDITLRDALGIAR